VVLKYPKVKGSSLSTAAAFHGVDNTKLKINKRVELN
jgi:hypothetical protein